MELGLLGFEEGELDLLESDPKQHFIFAFASVGLGHFELVVALELPVVYFAFGPGRSFHIF